MAKRKIIHSDEAPRAIGPYSQGVRTGDLLFVSGQIPLDPKTGRLVRGPIDSQTRRVLDNARAVLTAAGADLDNVVKATIYLTDLNDFPAVNAVYGEYFSSDPPARATVAVAALPLGSPIEIELVAHVGD
jgi:2-iminobutanoate/2-iminopropanoate deaminase